MIEIRETLRTLGVAMLLPALASALAPLGEAQADSGKAAKMENIFMESILAGKTLMAPRDNTTFSAAGRRQHARLKPAVEKVVTALQNQIESGDIEEGKKPGFCRDWAESIDHIEAFANLDHNGEGDVDAADFLGLRETRIWTGNYDRVCR